MFLQKNEELICVWTEITSPKGPQLKTVAWFKSAQTNRTKWENQPVLKDTCLKRPIVKYDGC